MPVEDNKKPAGRVIRFDQHEEEKILKNSADKIKNTSKLLDDSTFRIIKCVPSAYDDDGAKMQQTVSSTKRDYLLIECAFEDNGHLSLQYKRFLAYLKTKGLNIITSKMLENRDYPTCKVIVKI